MPEKTALSRCYGLSGVHGHVGVHTRRVGAKSGQKRCGNAATVFCVNFTPIFAFPGLLILPILTFLASDGFAKNAPSCCDILAYCPRYLYIKKRPLKPGTLAGSVPTGEEPFFKGLEAQNAKVIRVLHPFPSFNILVSSAARVVPKIHKKILTFC